jgi:hypothetical protein
MDTLTINELWRPVHGMLEQGLAVLFDEWKVLSKLKNFKQLSPRSIVWPVELTHGGGIAWTTNGGSTARATNNAPVEATDTWRHMVGRFEVGFDELDANSNGKFSQASITKQLNWQAADKLRSFRRALSIGVYGFNDAVLFETEAGTVDNGATLTIPITALYGQAGVAIGNIRDYLTAGKDYVAIVDQGTGAIAASGPLVSIDETNETITVTTAAAAAAITAGLGVVLYNQVLQDGTTDLDLGINGLMQFGLATTVLGIAEASNPDWVPGVRDTATGAALTGTQMYKDFNAISKRSDYKVEQMWTTDGVIAAAGGAQLDQKRYGADDDTMRLGFERLNIMGVLAEGKPYCPAGFAFYLNTKALKKLSPDESPDPKDVVTGGDRSGGFKQYENQLGFYKDQVVRAQLTMVSRLAFGIRGGITEA